MNKSQLVEDLASRISIQRGDAMKLLDSVLATITDGLRTDAKVTISGFGTFIRKRRSARTCMNPATKNLMEIRAFATCGFKPSDVLRQQLECESAAVGTR